MPMMLKWKTEAASRTVAPFPSLVYHTASMVEGGLVVTL
jgi:hypothetical protein